MPFPQFQGTICQQLRERTVDVAEAEEAEIVGADARASRVPFRVSGFKFHSAGSHC